MPDVQTAQHRFKNSLRVPGETSLAIWARMAIPCSIEKPAIAALDEAVGVTVTPWRWDIVRRKRATFSFTNATDRWIISPSTPECSCPRSSTFAVSTAKPSPSSASGAGAARHLWWWDPIALNGEASSSGSGIVPIGGDTTRSGEDRAVEQKVEEQREFVAWWESVVTPRQSPGNRGGNKSSSGHATIRR